jgi:hypothetical protein
MTRRRQLAGLTIAEYLDDEAEQAAARTRKEQEEARVAACLFTLEEIPEGGLFRVESGDKWEPCTVLITSSRQNAFDAANGSMVDTLREDRVTIQVYESKGDDFAHLAFVRKPGARRAFMDRHGNTAA